MSAEIVTLVGTRSSVATGSGLGSGWRTGLRDVLHHWRHVLRGEILPSRVCDRDELAPLPTELVGHHPAVKQRLELRDVSVAFLLGGECEV